jgi:SAM-dependent methyltransferase
VNDFERAAPSARLASDGHPVTRMLYERLGADLAADVRRRMAENPEIRRMEFERAEEDVWRFVVLNLGMWFDIPGVAARTGLLNAQPPEDVHSMARGPLAAAGGLDEADLVVSALRSAAVGVQELHTGLDFGCSSGRVVRVLAAACPTVRWLGCDPNERAIAWAREHIPGVEFLVSGDEPPLQFDSGSLDLVFASSVWSHFEPELGLRWFEDMHRVVRPGGCLVFTTHGLTSIAHDAEEGQRPPEQLSDIRQALYRRGWWYAPEFGEEGDWGVVNPGWGTAFITPEWLLAELCPRWRVLEFAPGRHQENQDVYVLERV